MTVYDDPYFAGRIVDKPGGKLVGTPPVSAWFVVCAVNLVVPTFLGIQMTDARGRIGMALGVVILLALGYRACFRFPEGVRRITQGGWLIALFQFWPMPQMLAGMIGVGIAEGTGLAESREFGLPTLNTITGGFIATLITGGLLIALAAAIGAICRGLTRLNEMAARLTLDRAFHGFKHR